MTEIRTVSSTGGTKGVKPERHALVPKKGLAAIARVFGFGAKKYAAHNWRKRYEWDKSIDALQRHIDDFVDGETLDLCKDGCEYYGETGNRTCRNHSGLPHLAHAGFHILVLLTWLEEDGEGVDNPFDTRWPAAMERLRLAEAEDADDEDPADRIAREAKERFGEPELDGGLARRWAMQRDEAHRMSDAAVRELVKRYGGKTPSGVVRYPTDLRD